MRLQKTTTTIAHGKYPPPLKRSAVLAHWKASIIATAQSIKAGDAAVKFEQEKQLTFCEVLPLLRLAERQLQFEYHQSMAVSASTAQRQG